MCESCRRWFSDETPAIEVRFGRVDEDEQFEGPSYDAFCTESAYAPVCDDCAVALIRGDPNP
jgi:hypothetical protein